MGDVISLAARRTERAVTADARPTVAFCFDLSSPWTYLAAERVEAQIAGATWVPVLIDSLLPATTEALVAERAAAGARAAALRMPLVWPEEAWPASGGAQPARAAMRVAHLAAEHGRAPAFVLAAGRLAFCGGFDLEDPEILAEAAAAAGLPFALCLQAMGDRERDAKMAADGQALLDEGADRAPVLAVGGALFCGEHRLPEAVAAHRGSAVTRRHAHP